jgi:hypothetical protein
VHAQVAQFLVYKAKKENDLNPMSLKKDFSPLFLKRNAYIRATVALGIYWRVQTCVAVQRKSGRKRSGKIMAKKKKGKKRKGKKNKQAS